MVLKSNMTPNTWASLRELSFPPMELIKIVFFFLIKTLLATRNNSISSLKLRNAFLRAEKMVQCKKKVLVAQVKGPTFEFLAPIHKDRKAWGLTVISVPVLPREGIPAKNLSC